MRAENQSLPDLDSPERIARFVDIFYARLLRDGRLAPIFVDVAGIDINEHLPRIRAYWEKLLLGHDNYRRHTMNIHRELHGKQALEKADFDQWLAYFHAAVDEHFVGPRAERAKRVAASIAANMQASLDVAGRQ